jgi:Fe-S cluster assembly protein SufB
MIGLTKKVVKYISGLKAEPSWMLESRLKAYEIFTHSSLPSWGPDLSGINFNKIRYYINPSTQKKQTWADVPASIKKTFERLGVPLAERQFLAGLEAQFNSEIIYSSLHKELEKKGVIFLSTDEALKKHPALFKKYFGTVISPNDNLFAALNTAVWSGGAFLYIPKGVHLTRPLQAYFRIQAKSMGQFERTLIIADEGSSASYVEGCTAPLFSSNSLHAGVVEVILKPNARLRYTTIQNWSRNVYNLVTKRAVVDKNAIMEWVDGNLGSKITMKYPSCLLVGQAAHGEMLSIGYADSNQHQDVGAKMIHLAPFTTSTIISKSISIRGGRTSSRGKIKVAKSAKNAKTHVECDALILDRKSASDTFPIMEVQESSAHVEHEATVNRIGEEKLFYLMSRGLTKEQAISLIVGGFIEPIVKELPMEYALELNRLIELEMEGSVG